MIKTVLAHPLLKAVASDTETCCVSKGKTLEQAVQGSGVVSWPPPWMTCRHSTEGCGLEGVVVMGYSWNRLSDWSYPTLILQFCYSLSVSYSGGYSIQQIWSVMSDMLHISAVTLTVTLTAVNPARSLMFTPLVHAPLHSSELVQSWRQLYLTTSFIDLPFQGLSVGGCVHSHAQDRVTQKDCVWDLEVINLTKAAWHYRKLLCRKRPCFHPG